ncbi:dentin sialophosphoprotein-like [Dreissena polymorpha]|uniref:Serine/arginine-rich splicing factor 2 n=1 Tax=Dreissena polymorpha TaxID=45954 RepID=A0A9D4CS46_DREPO|nr:dentin sialophosphoprotein-like [Dreissena polymorpha]KAH3730669.1 hypothetical protein DPMN_056660 [Dreissena polymorpha]
MASSVRVYDTYSVFVGKIHPDTKRVHLKDLFQPCGEVVDIAIIHRPENEYAFGFVRFSDPSAVYRAVSELNRWELNGTNLVVEVSKDTKEKLANGNSSQVPTRKRETNRKTLSSSSDHINDTMNFCRLQEAVTALNLEHPNGANLPLDKLVDSMKKMSGDRNPSLLGSLSKPVSTFEDVSKSLRQKSVQMGFREEFGNSLSAEYLTALGSLLTRISKYTDVENLLKGDDMSAAGGEKTLFKEDKISETGCEYVLEEDNLSDTGCEHSLKEDNQSQLSLLENEESEQPKMSSNRNLMSSMLDEPYAYKSATSNYDNKSQYHLKDMISDSGMSFVKSQSVKYFSKALADRGEELNQEVLLKRITESLPSSEIQNEEPPESDRQLINSVSEVVSCLSSQGVNYLNEEKQCVNKFSSQDTLSKPRNCLSLNGKLNDGYKSCSGVTSIPVPNVGTSNSDDLISDDPAILDFHVSPRSMLAVPDSIQKRQQKESFGAHVEYDAVKTEHIGIEKVKSQMQNITYSSSNSGSKLQRSDSTDSQFHRSNSSDSQFQRSDSSDSQFQRSDSSDSQFQRSDSSDSQFHRSYSSHSQFHSSYSSRSDDSTKGNHFADSGIESDSFSPTSHVSVKHSYPSDCVMASHNFSQSRVSGRQAGNRRKFLPDNHPQRPHEFNQQLYIEKNKGRGRSTVSVQSSDRGLQIVGRGMQISSSPAYASCQFSAKVANTVQSANKAIIPFGESGRENKAMGVGRGFKNLVLCKDDSKNTRFTKGCDLTVLGVCQKLPGLVNGEDSCHSPVPLVPAMCTHRLDCDGNESSLTSSLVNSHLSLGVRGVGRGFSNKL